MPGIDGSGPIGAGSMTGRGLGRCTDINAVRRGTGFGNGLGRGCRGGFGRGFGRGIAWNQPFARTQKDQLQEQRDILKERLDKIDEELEDL